MPTWLTSLPMVAPKEDSAESDDTLEFVGLLFSGDRLFADFFVNGMTMRFAREDIAEVAEVVESQLPSSRGVQVKVRLVSGARLLRLEDGRTTGLASSFGLAPFCVLTRLERPEILSASEFATLERQYLEQHHLSRSE